MKKIYLLLTCLLSLFGGISTAMAQDDAVQIPINANAGDYTAWNGNASSPWARGWASTSTDPQVTISCGANNFAPWNGTDFQFFNCVGGSGTSYEYTFAVSSGWEFVSLSLDFVASAADAEVYVEVEGETSEVNNSTEDPIHFEAEFAEETTSFGFIVGANAASRFAKTTNFVITVKKADAFIAAIAELYAAWEKYQPYTTEGDNAFAAGPEPGNYDADLVAKFNEIFTYSQENGENLETAEEVLALRDQLVEAYEAVVASKNTSMILADGYYRFRTAIDYNDGETKYIYVVNGDGTINGRWGTREDLSTDCPSLFQIKNDEEGTIDIISMATDARFNDNPSTLSVESTNRYVLEPAVTIEGITYVAIRRSDAEQGAQAYIHQAGHGSGAGTGSNLTSWYPSYPTTLANKMGGSEWVIEAVDEATAQAIIEAYAPIKDREEMVAEYQLMVSDATDKLFIAKDDPVITVDEETALVTDVEQLSSPWTESSEGSLEELLDGDTGTYWHSAWSGGSVDNHTHYLDVALKEAVHSLVAMTITRRQADSDHITLWSVYGSATGDTYYTEEDELPEGAAIGDIKTAGEWHKVATLSTPFGNNTETITSLPFDTKGYTHLRFYIDGTTTGRGYAHMSEFQLNPATVEIADNAQYIVMGALATNLEQVLNDQIEVEASTLTAEQFNALKAVYEPFIAKFVDPAPLREALTAAEAATAGIVVGENPGEWSAESGAGQLAAIVVEAKAYDASGNYDAAKSEAYIEQLGAQAEDIFAMANKIQEGKWYRIHFGSKEAAEANEWDIDSNEPSMSHDIMTNEALWDKYVTVAEYDSEETTVTVDGQDDEGNPTSEEVTVTIHKVVPVEEDAVIIRNHELFFDADEDIADKDLSLFRFVNVGDSAYVIQNKATGLFIGANSGVTLDVIPSLFNVRAIGYGQNLIAATNLITDANQNYLHAQRAYNVLVTWTEDYVGSRSGLYIEEVGDVEESYDGTAFNMSLKPGSVNSFCFPVGISAGEDDNIYDVVEVKDGVIKLNELTSVTAGRPFIYIATGDYDAELDDAEPVAFRHDYTFGKEAIAGPLLKGTYSTISSLPKGAITTQGNGFVISKSAMMSMISVPAYTAYIQGDEEFPLVDYTYELTAIEDGIAATMQQVAATGELYTIDGRLLSRKANLSDLKRYGKGLYILNGVKVAVK